MSTSWEGHIAGRAGAAKEEEEAAGRMCALGRWCEHGQGGGGNGETHLASLGLQLLELVLAQSAPCMEIKYWTQIIQMFLN